MTVLEKFLLTKEFNPILDYKSNLTALVIFAILCGITFLIDYYVYSRRHIENNFEKKYYVFSESWYVLELLTTAFGQFGTFFILVFKINSFSLVPIMFIIGPCLPIFYASKYNMVMKKSKKLIKEEKAAEKEKLMSAIRNEY